MIYTFIPYSVDKNYGEACNEMMDLLPEDGWGCILDHDICFTTYNWYVQLNEIIKKNVNGTYTACCNRIGNFAQQAHDAPNNNNIAAHRIYGEHRATRYWTRIKRLSRNFSGVLILTSKQTWKKVGGFKTTGILQVDHHFHESLKRHDLPIYLMKGFYVYHWYRGGNRRDTQHLVN